MCIRDRNETSNSKMIPIIIGRKLISTLKKLNVELPINVSNPIEVPLIFPDSYAILPTKRDRKINDIAIFLINLLSISVKISLRPFLDIIPSLELIS